MRLIVFASLAALLVACAKEPPARWIDPATQIEFALLPAGDFVAGSPATEPGHQEDEQLYPVRVANRFYMSVFEVTRAQWNRVMNPQAAAVEGGDLPVVDITWFDAREFLERLNRMPDTRPQESGPRRLLPGSWRLQPASRGHFRLPTEIEWEYACRAGTTSPYSTGATLTTDQANYNGDFPLPGQSPGENRGHLTRAGSFPPNAWGLHDMHGNAWEWTSEGYDEERKVIRGGSWRFNADSARCALRYTHRPQDRGDSLGFRIVREIPRP